MVDLFMQSSGSRKSRRWLISVLILLVIVVLCWWFWPVSTPGKGAESKRAG
ncbi:HlyD family secretion protein, partial [Pseudomonas syringae pv. actinidiae ICMP 18886]